ncbi:glycosyl hydrolase family 61-domain-containing protein [Epithele typhae]|uniref:glycosyl hydrolase family 61-domain-containing protein n=1 Tax=Epithele typhae TaxID=378194 RepID=UPI002008BA13|nr:glycosyl hydrolase family 61-domain-containing protein [Epithele typhae]KAH9941875.1 glycosyl hydrolase family 61-domain-containing protein [Epithele typhae]
MFAKLALLVTFVAGAAAHATFQELWINGVDQGSSCVRLPASNSPVTSVTSNDIACNANAASSKGVCQVMPGDSVSVEMHQQPGDRSCANEAIGGDHFGPVQIYMAKVSDATSAVGSSAAWFKVTEMGMPSMAPDYWATEVLNNNCGHFTFTVPSGIAPGNYLIRAEVIALHVASTLGQAQFYMSCYQINVGGSGTASPPTVKFPGAYSASDPGILINIYTQLNSYIIPGPTPYASTSPTVATTPWPTTATWNTALQPSTVPTAVPTVSGSAPPASSSSASTTTVASSTSKTTSSSTTKTTSSTVASSTPTSGSGTVAKYGQCGGTGYTGPTVCVSGSTCSVLNPCE